MNKFRAIRNAYQKGGILAVFRAVWLHIGLWGPSAPLVQRLLGKRLQQKLLMFATLGYWPNTENPSSFSEKIAHRKLYTDRSLYTTVSDKWEVREYVQSKVGEEILNEVYHVTDDPETIPFDTLPSEFVIKANHGSGWNIIVDDKNKEDSKSIVSQCNSWLESTFGVAQAEYWYWDIDPKILVERRMHDEEHDVPLDFKFFVFHGEVKYVQVDYDRYGDHTRTFYDSDWNALGLSLKFPKGPETDEPGQLDEMIDIAETLGEDFDFMRVDLYQPNGERVVFGELTVGPGSGIERFAPRYYDFEFGSHW